MSIEIKHLRTLHAMRSEGSLARAAAHLHTTQSALSHQIKELESRLDTPLYFRQGRQLQLTQAGEALLRLADQVLPAIDGALYLLQQQRQGESGRLHIALECHSCFDWLIPALDSYRQQWPDVELDLTLAHSFTPMSALLRGEVDMVITSDPVANPDLVFVPLFAFEALLVMAGQHRLRNKDWIAPQDLAEETLITYPVNQDRLDIFRHFLNPAGVVPAAVRHSELTVMILQWVASGRGVAALPNWAVSDAMANGRVLGKPLGAQGSWSQLYCGLRRREASHAYLQAFVEVAKFSSQQNLKGIRELAATDL